METEHTETIVEKAVAYVKDMFGLPPGDRTPDVEAKPHFVDTALEPATEDVLRLDDPHAYAFKKIVERSRCTTIDAERDNSAAGARTKAAEAFDDIQDNSHRAREEVIEATYAPDGMIYGESLPSDSEMQQAVERAREANSEEKSHQAEHESVWP